ncbi:beta/gamma crystallin-related protein [Aestuariicoccus sp. MJ-SS9]|uniref:beta/gamma crystallin-related protein n=1 Tax=Aestuariicoccus sp. MJ-SS9 TaxID=3079855 RepID=UPI002906C3BF|nr:beta/gamma crystallin-related protein [Aestuariicoccus sp. MJ-SS9]MDU8913629.1 beta/gamma crystallin-related protein [Aestuariicoccus sp. MJ-SS9]
MSKIIVFDKQNYEGSDTMVAEDNVESLKGTGLNNDISSIIVISGTWVLYEHVNYSGKSWTVSDSGGPAQDGCYPTFTDWTGSGDNNEIGSFKVQGT